jgi:hypothetical protein
MRVPRPDLGLANEVRRGGRTDHGSEPAPVGRTPGGLARVADILPPQQRVEPERGGLAGPHDVVASPAQVAAGFVCHSRDSDGGEVPRTHEVGQMYGVPTIGVDTVAGLLGHA